MRLHSEPPQGVAEEKLARFIAQCQVKMVGVMKDMKLRWNPTSSWGTADTDSPLVAKPVSCKILNPS
jgi:hypothetical protein